MRSYVKNADIIVVSKQSVSSLPTTISDSRITPGHVVLRADLSNRKAMRSVWSFTTSAGEVALSGTIQSGETTNITLYLGNSAISI